MQKQQIILITGGLALLLGLYFWGPTVAPAKKISEPVRTDSGEAFSIEKYREMVLNQLPSALKGIEKQLEESYQNKASKDDGHSYLHKLSGFWRDSVQNPTLHYFYEARLAELDNTEKSLTFAAHSILGYLPYEQNPAQQHWLAGEGKALFEKALKLNSTNDSTIIGLGGCIMYGAPTGSGSNSMEGIMKVREVAQRDSTNIFAQYMLGIGGLISKQYDRAIVRFEKVVKAQPDNLEAVFKLAEAFELAGRKTEAVACYEDINRKVDNAELKIELTKRIAALKSN
jgi:tetratricopeptide (TPR) repeat protein